MPTTISVVIPTYNSASVIEQCLASINDQTYAAQNVVVCDGGSSDATIDIATPAVQPWFVLWRVDRHSETQGPESLRGIRRLHRFRYEANAHRLGGLCQDLH